LQCEDTQLPHGDHWGPNKWVRTKHESAAVELADPTGTAKNPEAKTNEGGGGEVSLQEPQKGEYTFYRKEWSGKKPKEQGTSQKHYLKGSKRRWD